MLANQNRFRKGVFYIVEETVLDVKRRLKQTEPTNKSQRTRNDSSSLLLEREKTIMATRETAFQNQQQHYRSRRSVWIRKKHRWREEGVLESVSCECRRETN